MPMLARGAQGKIHAIDANVQRAQEASAEVMSYV